MATLPGFDENTCNNCAKLNHGQPPCIRAQHMADRTGRVCLRVVKSPGGLCGYHAQWQYLAGDLYNAPKPANKARPELANGPNWIAYQEGTHQNECTISSKLILGQIKEYLMYFMANHEVVVKGNTRGKGLNSVMLYDPYVGEGSHYAKRGQQLIALDQFAILRAIPHDPKFSKVLQFFNQKVTAATKAKLEFDPEGCKTDWKFDTYGSGADSIGPAAGTAGTIVLIAPDKKKWRYAYGGPGGTIGVGVPFLPSGGPEEFPTLGRIQKNPDIPELSVNSFCGPCVFSDASLIGGLGVSGTVMTTGINPTRNPKYTAHIYMGGMSAGITANGTQSAGKVKLLGPA